MVSFDLRETLIPFSLLQISNLFRDMEPGEEMEILAGTDPTETSILNDVLLILPSAHYDLISRETIESTSPVTRLRLRKIKDIHSPSKKGKPSCLTSI